ncbi:conserved Plasmodium protein, unknown function [Plasmodium chabaudi chabaudi]|uniref:AMP-dependent synthetase/ligase domain-containing protein n=1 Tax=Plasmodium chabaudi chabaudi TaxID=31271 RepID=A0A1D3S077_PLACU|nr:conserved Plasmodium protein, unknown function [Plasmodium chabaudi chabaudi]
MRVILFRKLGIARRMFGTIQNILNEPFNIYTNNHIVTSTHFSKEVYVMNNKLLYYIRDYFKLNYCLNIVNNNHNKTRIGCLFPPCYSQLIFKFCILLNNFDYVSIPTPIYKSKQIKQRYSFYIAENNIDLILCHPFYKHYIEEIAYNLQLPYLICYDKPDIITPHEYLEDLQEGKENFAHNLFHNLEKSNDLIKEWTTNIEGNENAMPNSDKNFEQSSNLKSEIKTEKDKNDNYLHMQLSKENECDKSIKFKLSDILEQGKCIRNAIEFNEGNKNVLICLPANNIQYFDILFSMLNMNATIIYPEICKNKLLKNNYMEWFKNNMKSNKDNNFSIHDLMIKNDFTNSDFDFIDGPTLFEEIQNNEQKINIIICNNYLLRDFITFFENSQINNITKREFIQKKASHINTIIINGNEIMPGINKKYIDKIKDVFINAKIYQRYIIQEIGTVCILDYDQLDNENIHYDRKLAGYILPNISIKIDKETNLMKIKSDNIFSEYYNNNKITENSFDQDGFFKTKYLASINEGNSLLKIEGIHNSLENLPDEYYLYYKQRRDKMEKHPPGYLKRVKLQGKIWGNFHANKKNWKRKF